MIAEARAFCHTFGRGEGKHQMVPGRPYSVVAVLRRAARPGRRAGRVLSHDANRRRFLTAAQDFTEAWEPAFDEEFGRAAQPDGAAA
ncbi:hypothetical protein [Streptomyces sp. NPDC056817]|uniref:hypothetical protein n=1 Tax=Streptomyces sp. NPDC056817 TaxID=3345950 RepID=UPI003679C3A8